MNVWVLFEKERENKINMHVNMILLCCVLLGFFFEQTDTKVMQPLDPNIIKDFGYVKYKSSNTKLVNGVMNSADPEESTKDLLLYRMVMTAIRLAKARNATAYNGPLRIYGEGVEHKFPPFLERILQRIQTYFSVYKYTDTSQPWFPVNLTSVPIATTTTTINYSSTGTTTTISTIVANNIINLKSTTSSSTSTSTSSSTSTETSTARSTNSTTKEKF